MFSAAALALTFAACSNEDVVIDNPIAKDTSYVNVKIVMGGNTNGTRAEGYAANEDNEFDSGIKEEAQVHNLAVYLYDEGGRLVGMGTKAGFADPTKNNNNVSDTYDEVIEVNLVPGSAEPKYLLAFVNSKDVPRDVLDNLYTQTVTSVGNLTDGLTMSTSRYFAGEAEDTWFKGTEMTSADLYDTYAEAANPNNTPLEIYVERLAAKMTVDKNKETIETTADQRLYGLDNKEYKITFNVKKWAATGMAREMYYVKNAFDPTLKSWANAKNNNRSYWANGVYHGVDYAEMTSKLYYVSANQVLYSESDKGMSLGADNALYVPEHTYGKNALKTPFDAENPDLPRYYNHMMTATSAIVVGQYAIESTNGGNPEHFSNGKGGYDFYISLRGFDGVNETLTIYTKNDLIKTLLERNLKELTIDAAGTKLTEDKYAEYVELKKTADKQYTLASTGKTLYLDGTAVDDFSEAFKATINAAHYKNGWAYFFIPVVHNQNLDADTQEGAVGVVRNHSYKILINSITGLGAPLDESKVGDDPENTPPTETDPDDPDDPDPDPEDPGDIPIIPDPDMLRNAYIDATLNVLSWHNAKDQIVDLK